MSETTSPQVEMPNVKNAHGILSAGLPSDDQLAAARAAGYQTVINLQVESEKGAARVRQTAEQLGFAYIAIPVAGAKGVTPENASQLDRALADCAKPVVVHCAGGNRVGALMALRAKNHQGMSATDALAVGKETGLTGLEPVVRAALGL